MTSCPARAGEQGSRRGGEDETDLSLCSADHGRQPATLPRVHQEVNDIVLPDKSFELLEVLPRRVSSSRRDRVTRHRDREGHSAGVLRVPN